MILPETGYERDAASLDDDIAFPSAGVSAYQMPELGFIQRAMEGITNQRTDRPIAPLLSYGDRDERYNVHGEFDRRANVRKIQQAYLANLFGPSSRPEYAEALGTLAHETAHMLQPDAKTPYPNIPRVSDAELAMAGKYTDSHKLVGRFSSSYGPEVMAGLWQGITRNAAQGMAIPRSETNTAFAEQVKRFMQFKKLQEEKQRQTHTGQMS